MLCEVKHLIILHYLGSRNICHALLQYKHEYSKIHQICPQMLRKYYRYIPGENCAKNHKITSFPKILWKCYVIPIPFPQSSYQTVFDTIKVLTLWLVFWLDRSIAVSQYCSIELYSLFSFERTTPFSSFISRIIDIYF